MLAILATAFLLALARRGFCFGLLWGAGFLLF